MYIQEGRPEIGSSVNIACAFIGRFAASKWFRQIGRLSLSLVCIVLISETVSGKSRAG